MNWPGFNLFLRAIKSIIFTFFPTKKSEQQLLIRKAIITRRGLNRLYLILSGLLILFTSGGRLISRESILFPTVITRTR
jgi:hypothetical protein